MSHNKPARYFSALPSYFGGKRKLVPYIFGALDRLVSSPKWGKYHFIDAFSGGGSVSLAAKAYGFGCVYSNDWSLRSNIIHRGLLDNKSIFLTRTDVLSMATYPNKSFHPNLQNLVGTVFSERHALALSQGLHYADSLQCQTKKALVLLLLWKLVLEYVAFGTSVGTSNRPFVEVLDGKKPWYSLNPKRLRDKSFSRLLEPSWTHIERHRKAINRGVFGAGGETRTFQEYVFKFLPQVSGQILYLDPPYPGTLSYEKENKVLDQVLFGERDLDSYGISPFTEDIGALSQLLKQATHIQIWLVSLNNKIIDERELGDFIKAIDPKRKVETNSWKYGHLSHVSNSERNRELLVTAYVPKDKGK